MVAPITGPFEKHESSKARVLHSTSMRQKRPYVHVLPHDFRLTTLEASSDASQPGAMEFGDFHYINQDKGWYPNHWNLLSNAAYEKLRGAVNEKADLLTAIAEIGKTYQMVGNRLIQLISFARKLKKFDFAGAAESLGESVAGSNYSTLKTKVSHKWVAPKNVSVHKSFASNFLEYSYGWAPTIQDLYSAADVLTSDFPIQPVSVKVSSAPFRADLSEPQSGSNPNAFYPGFNTWESYRYWEAKRGVACGCLVKVVNPNLHLAASLGLTNPGATAWELVPFSFVVDKVLNVGQLIGSLTDWHGLALSEEWTSYSMKGISRTKAASTYRWVENGNYVTGGSTQFNSCKFAHIVRVNGIPTPVPTVGWLKAPGLRTCTSLFAVLTQLLTK